MTVTRHHNKTALVIRHVAFEDLGVLAPLLNSDGFNVTYLDAGCDNFAAFDALTPDLLIVLGGPIGIYETDRYPFLTAEIDFISARLKQDLPTLGICLGAQAIAAASGARVYAGDSKEIGWAPLQLTAATSVLAPLADLPVLHWHGDTFDLPTGAVLLASTPAYANQAFTNGRTLALQFHLEIDVRRFESWLIGHAAELSAANIDLVQLRADAKQHGQALALAAQQVLENWCMSVGLKITSHPLSAGVNS